MSKLRNTATPRVGLVPTVAAWLRAALVALARHGWAFALIVLLMSVAATMVVVGMVNFLGVTRDIQLELLAGDVDAGTLALLRLTFQLGIPGVIILGLIASAGFGGITVLADQVLAGTPKRTGVAIVHGIRRSIISFLTAAIAITVVILLLLLAPVVSILGIVGLMSYPLLRKLSQRGNNSRIVVAARALTARRLIILAVPFAAVFAVAVCWMLAFAISVFEPGGPLRALRTSREQVRGRGVGAVIAVTASVLLSLLLQAGIGLLVTLVSTEAAVLVQGAVQLLIAPLAFIVIVAILRSGRTAANAHGSRPNLPRVKSLVGMAAVLSVTLVATLLVVPATPAYANTLESTTLLVSTSPNPSSPGQAVTITLTVVPSVSAPDGITGSAMVWIDGLDPLEMGINAGIGSLDFPNFPTGTTSYTAEYMGNGEFEGSTASSTHTVDSASGAVATASAIESNAEPSRFGISPTFTAQITAPGGAALTGDFTPSGGLNSTISIDGTVVPVWVNNDGIASIFFDQAPQIAVGSHTISFAYPGNGYFEPTLASYTHTVVKTGTTSSIGITPLTPRSEENYSISVTVAPDASGLAAPSGDVIVTMSGDATQYEGTLVGGVATIPATAPFTSGQVTYTVNYPGDAFYEASSSTVTADIVDRYPTTTTLTVAPTSTNVGDVVRFTATVEADPGAGTPTGVVRFSAQRSGYPGYSEVVALANGVAEHDFTPMAVAAYTVTADYTGATEFAGSTSATVELDSVRTSPTLTLTADEPSTVRGEPVTFTVTASGVPGLTATGDVTISGAGLNETVSLSGPGVASFTTSVLPIGTHTLSANYAGDSTYLATTATLDHEVALAASTVATTASWSTPWTAPAWGQSVTLTANVSSASGSGLIPGGDLKFEWTGGSQIVTLNASGRAELALATLPVGTDTITTTYLGDGYYLGASDDVDVTVDKAVTKVLLLPSNSTPVVGEPVTYTATVSVLLPGSGVPTGSVSFSVPHADPVVVPVDAYGVASVVMPTNAAISPYIVVAGFSGDSNTLDSVGEFRPAVSKGSATLSTTTSVTTAPLGNSIDLTVTATAVAPSTAPPTGTLRVLRDGGWVFAIAADPSGVTVIPMDIAWLGDKSISVELISDNYTAPNSNSITVTGTAFTPLLSLSTSSGSTLAGDPVTLTARIDTPFGYSLDGEISFYDGASLLGTQWISARGQTVQVRLDSFVTSSLSAGTHQLHAEFTSNVARSTDAASTDSQVTVGALTATTHIVNPDYAQIGEPIEWLVSVTSPDWNPGNLHRDPTGSVELFVDSVQIGSGILGTPESGRAFATISTPPVTAGNHVVEARFVPTSMHSPSSETGSLVVYSSETLMTVTSGSPTVLWGDTLSYSVSVEPRTGTWPTPSGSIIVTNDDNMTVCTLTAAGGNCPVSWNSTGTKTLTFTYSGDGIHSPATATRSITVNKRTPAITATVAGTHGVTGDPFLIGWDVVGPSDGTVTVSTTGGVAPCTSAIMMSQCGLMFPLGLAGATLSVVVNYAGNTLWSPVFVTKSVAIVGCYPVALSVNPASAGTITALRAPDCNSGTGYIGGSTLGLTVTPIPESDPTFDWKFSGFEPGTAAGTPQDGNVLFDIVVGPRGIYDTSAGPTNWVRADFSKVFNCFSVQVIAVNHNGSTGRLDAPAPNCPVDAAGLPVSSPRWTTTTEQVGVATNTTLTGRMLAGTVFSPIAVPGNAESEIYAFRNSSSNDWSVQNSAPSVHADRPGLSTQVLFGPRCHNLDLHAEGNGRLNALTRDNCENRFSGQTGWTAGTTVELWANPLLRQRETGAYGSSYEAIPSYIVDWVGADTATAPASGNIFTPVPDGKPKIEPGDQVNTVTILGVARASAADQAVTVNFESCMKFTVGVVLSYPAKGTSAIGTPANCPGYESDASLFMPGTSVSVSATPVDTTRKQLIKSSAADKPEYRNVPVWSMFGQWSDGSTQPDHTFVVKEDSHLTASFWFRDPATGIDSCQLLNVKSGYPERLLVGVYEEFIDSGFRGTSGGCARGTLSETPSVSQSGKYLVTLDPEVRPANPAPVLELTAVDSVEDASAFAGWEYQVFVRNYGHLKGASFGRELRIEGTEDYVYGTALLCEKLDLRVSLTNDKGETYEQGVPEDSPLVMVSPAPNCPFDDKAWRVGTTVEVGAFGNQVGYAFSGWMGESDSHDDVTPILLDGVSHKQIVASYTVTCFALELPLRNTGMFGKILEAANGPSGPNYVRSDITRYPEPNCPGYPASTGLYAGGTTVSLYGHVASNKVWQGWVGDMVQPGKVNPVTVIMDADKSATHRWRDRNTGEDIEAVGNDIGDAFVSIGDDVAIYAKKMTAVLALIMVEVVKWMPPMGVVNAILATSALIADLAVLAGAPRGSVEFLKAGQKIMDFALSGMSCAATWGFNGNGSQNAFAQDPGTPASSDDFGDKSSEEQMVSIGKGVKSANTTYKFVSAARSGYAAAKLFAIEDALGGTLGVASPGISSALSFGSMVLNGGLGWDSSADKAWTDGSAYSKCLAGKVPSF